MADTARTLAALQTLFADNTSGDISAQDLRDFLVSTYQPQGICDGRLTLESGVRISTSDQTAKTSVYLTPYGGNLVALHDGTSWKLNTFTERTLALGTITSGKNYDVFLYDNSGTLTLELSAAWNSDNVTRTDALTTQDGIYVKSGATTRRYVGTIRTTSTTTTEDSATKRFVWNAQNRVMRPLLVKDATSSWTYGTASYRQARANAANQVEVVVGLSGESLLDLSVCGSAGNSMSGSAFAIGEDSTSAAATESLGRVAMAGPTYYTSAVYSMKKRPTIGYHYYAWLEQASDGVTVTFYGTTSDYFLSGLSGVIEA